MHCAVIIPTYNRVQYVAKAIDSVLAQSLAAHEIIVVDDGSSDDTAAVILARYPQVTLIVQAHAGVSAARNRGIRAAHSDWIAFLDSDDTWSPPKLSQQWQALQASGALACHTDEIWLRHGRRVNPMQYHAKPDGEIFFACLPRCCVSPSCVVLHRSIFSTVGVFDSALPACEDYDLWLRIFSRYRIKLVRQQLVVRYAGHADQLSQRHWGMDRFRIAALHKLLQTAALSAAQRAAAIATLLEKCRIFINGSIKRGQWQRVAAYQAIADQWHAPAAHATGRHSLDSLVDVE